MIVKKYWRRYKNKYTKYSDCKGYFLFGFIPIYVEMHPWIG